MEIELKAPLPAGIEAKLNALGAKPIGQHSQSDVFYDFAGRPLWNTEKKYVRLRKQEDGYILTYKHVISNDGAKSVHEHETRVGPEILDILAGIGLIEYLRIEKTRKEYGLDGLTVCIDDVKGLGQFIEVEAIVPTIDEGKAKVHALFKKLGIDPATAITVGYPKLMRDKLGIAD